jgi:hypothetical protein
LYSLRNGPEKLAILPAEKFIRLLRIKQKFIRIAYLYSKCTDCRIKTQAHGAWISFPPPPFPTFLTLQDKRNIRTLSLNIKFICTRCETGLKSSLFCLFLKLVQINFIFTDNVRILYMYYVTFIFNFPSQLKPLNHLKANLTWMFLW